jgi:hypothetical protein
MNKRAARLVAPIVVVSVCLAVVVIGGRAGGQGESDELRVARLPEPASSKYAVDKRAAVWINLAPRDLTPDNPHGYRIAWLHRETAEEFLLTQLARADNIIFRMEPPQPWRKGQMAVTSKIWFPVERWRRELIITTVNEWLAGDKSRTFSIYMGAQVGDPHRLTMLDAQRPDPKDPRILTQFRATIDPWLQAIDVHRIWLDNGSNPINIYNVLELSVWARKELDQIIGVEAYPRRGTNQLDVPALRMAPSIALSRYAETFDPDHRWRIPAGIEALLVVTNHHPLTAPEIADYRRRGFIVCSGHPDFDELVLRQPDFKPDVVGLMD